MADIVNDPAADGSVGRRIEKTVFLQMARAYKEQRLSLIAEYGNNKNDSRSCYFSKDVFEAILRTGCSGIRIYYGVRTEPTDGKQYTNLMLVGVKVDPQTGVEELVKLTEGADENEEALYDWGQLCPPGDNCDLNQLIEEIDQP